MYILKIIVFENAHFYTKMVRYYAVEAELVNSSINCEI